MNKFKNHLQIIFWTVLFSSQLISSSQIINSNTFLNKPQFMRVKGYESICMLSILFQQAFGWFKDYEQIMAPTKIAGLPTGINSHGYLVEFSDYTFGINYNGPDSQCYAGFIKHGELLYPPVQITTENCVGSPYACPYNDEYMMIMNRVGTAGVNVDKRMVGRMIKKSDGTLMSEFDITGIADKEGGNYGDCVQVKDKIFIPHFYQKNSWDAFMRVYDFSTNSVGPNIMVNQMSDEVHLRQHGVKFAVLEGDNDGKVILLFQDEDNDKFYLQLLDENANIIKRGNISATIVRISYTYYIRATQDGGFIVIFLDDNGGTPPSKGLFATKFDKNLNQVCLENFHGSISNFQSVVLYKDTVFVNFMHNSGSPREQVITRYVNVLDCKLQSSEDKPYMGVSGTNLRMPVIGKTKGTDSYILGLLISIDNTDRDIMFAEYYLDQFTDCPEIECAACFDQDNQCRVCKGTTTEQRGIRDNATDNDCLCDPGYFNDPNQYDCEICSYLCATCDTSADNCLTCSVSANRSTSVPCKCEQHYYDNGVDIACNECDAICLGCELSATNCTSCNSATRQIPDCSCKIGFYETNATDCLECHHSCSTCITDAVTCTVCSDSNREGPNCECRKGYFNKGTDAKCEKCDITCLECSGDSKSCTKCKDNSTRSGPNCACKTGLYETGTGGKCIDYCSSKCDSCSVNYDNCTSCVSNRSNSSAPDCSYCNDGYYESGTQPFVYCISCMEDCKNCQNGTECTQCKSEDLLPPLCKYSKENYTQVVSDDGTIIDIRCDPKCDKCTGKSDNCVACKGMNRLQENCECADGFHDFENTSSNCIACPSLCKTCLNPTHCYSCTEEKMEINTSTNQCQCKKEFEDYGGDCIEICKDDQYWRNGKCNQCYFYQLDICLEACPSHTTKNGVKCEEKEFSTVVLMIIVGVLLLGGLLFYILVKKMMLSNRNKNQQQQKELNPIENVEYAPASNNLNNSIQLDNI